MPKTLPKQPQDYIVPFNLNGMDGRMVKLPAPKGKTAEILMIYGSHSSLERWWGLYLAFNRYGSVTAPDLPGFGGMDSFYKIGKKPTLDNLADYLAAFIKLRYKKNQKIVIVGMSLGFVLATRMLQRYPELTDRVQMMVSLVGFAHKDDFILPAWRHNAYLALARTFRHRPLNYFFRYVALNSFVLRTFYARTHNAKHKFKNSNPEEFTRAMDMEISLWHNNEVRTYSQTVLEFLQLDICTSRVKLPLWHVGAKSDHFFNNYHVEQHLNVIYKPVHMMSVDFEAHAPSVIADEKEAAFYIPAQLKRQLAKQR